MQKDRRLTKTSDFEAVKREGNKWSDNFLVLVTRCNDSEVTRYGFSVGKKVGNSVVRNAVKRRVREVARSLVVQDGWDLVVVARRDAGMARSCQLRHSMTKLLFRAGLLSGTSSLDFHTSGD